MVDQQFLTEACRLWRALYGTEVAFYQAARDFEARIDKRKPETLRFIAANATRLAAALVELAEPWEADEKDPQ